MGADKSPARRDVLPGQGNKPLSRPAHALGTETVIAELEAQDNTGLSSAEAKQRLELYGKNELGDGPGVQPAKILLRQVANAMTLVRVSYRQCWR